MSEYDELVCEVDYHAVESINIHSLITDNQFSIPMLLICEYKHVCISDIKLVPHVDDELAIQFFFASFWIFHNWVFRIHPKEVKSKLSFGFVSKDIEASGIINDRFD